MHRCAAHIAPAAQLYVCSDAGCTAVRVDSSGVYTCMEGVISPVQLYGSSDTVCTRVHAVYTKKSRYYNTVGDIVHLIRTIHARERRRRAADPTHTCSISEPGMDTQLESAPIRRVTE